MRATEGGPTTFARTAHRWATAATFTRRRHDVAAGIRVVRRRCDHCLLTLEAEAPERDATVAELIAAISRWAQENPTPCNRDRGAVTMRVPIEVGS